MIIVGVVPAYEEGEWVEWAAEGIINFVDERVLQKDSKVQAGILGIVVQKIVP